MPAASLGCILQLDSSFGERIANGVGDLETLLATKVFPQ